MPRKIAWTDQAKAALRAIDQATAFRILHIVARRLTTGEGGAESANRPWLRRLVMPQPHTFLLVSLPLLHRSEA